MIKINSKKVLEGDSFIPIIGEVYDGHSFIEEAVKNGAKTVYHSKNIPELKKKFPKVEFIKVDSTTETLGLKAKEHLELLRKTAKINNPKPIVIAITGSVGKTTTKDLIGRILSKYAKTVRAKGSFNNEIGVPLTILEANKNTKFLVIEIGANHSGEIKYLTDIVKPDVAVWLRAGVAHIGEFGSSNNIVIEKAEILKNFHKPELGFAIMNEDDPAFNKTFKQVQKSAKVISYSPELAEKVKDKIESLKFEYEDIKFKTNLTGSHNISNVLAAFYASKAALKLADIYSKKQLTEQVLANNLKDIEPRTKRRMQISTRNIKEGKLTIIDDSYNANPDSMKAALKSLGLMKKRNSLTIAVLGEMKELGSRSKAMHKEVGEAVKKEGIQILITVGNEFANEYNISSEKSQNSNLSFKTLEDAKKNLAKTIRKIMREKKVKEAVILFKSSNSARTYELADLMKFYR